MPHVLILGMTESGKTSLAKQLAAQYKAQGIGVIVLDPLHDPGWNADIQTGNSDAFLDAVKKSRSCAVFIDESGEMIGQYNKEMQWLATRARHYGHNSHFIAQRGAQLSPNIRDMCGHLFVFNISRVDSELIAREWNRDELLEANKLKKLEYFHCSRFGDLTRSTVDFSK